MASDATREAARVHGGIAEAELRALGIDRRELIDFSASCNPFGPAPAVASALARAPLERYPDPRAARACAAIAATLELDPDRIALGNGAAELLWTLARLLLRADTPLVIAEPAFSELRSAATRIGARVHSVRARASAGFALELDALFAAVDACAAEVVYLCAPSSPSGAPLFASELERHARTRPRLQLIVDESYLSLSERWQDARAVLPDNVIRVRSLTKEQGIPGVRVGYLVAEPSLITRLEAERPAWTTGAHAQAAALAACETTAFVADSRARLLGLRASLADGLSALGLAPVPSSANFLIVPVRHAARLRASLLQRNRLLVRDCASFGLENYVRIAARPEPELARLLDALATQPEPNF